MTAPYVRPDAALPPYTVGQRVLYGCALFEITSVQPNLTPYRRAGQETKVTGWTLGLRRVGEKRTGALFTVATMAAIAGGF